MCEKKVSVIIVTYNSSNLIRECLESILTNNDIGIYLEVIIVDNDSSDFQQTELTARSIIHDVKIIRNTMNGGYGQGNNIGIKAATGEIILIMNPDVRLFMPVFVSAIKHFGEQRLGLLGMQQYEAPSVRRQSFLSLKSGPIELLRYKFYYLIGIYSSKFFCIHGACFFIRKQAIEEIGYFDEEIFLYNEEIDIHLRLIKDAKYTIELDKQMGYVHPMHSRVEYAEGILQRIKTYLYVCKKNEISKNKTITSLIWSYRLLQFKAACKGKMVERNEYQKVIASLKKMDC